MALVISTFPTTQGLIDRSNHQFQPTIIYKLIKVLQAIYQQKMEMQFVQKLEQVLQRQQHKGGTINTQNLIKTTLQKTPQTFSPTNQDQPTAVLFPQRIVQALLTAQAPVIQLHFLYTLIMTQKSQVPSLTNAVL